MKINAGNERMKRKYFKWCREALGFSDSTINSIEKSILLYDDFSKNANYVTFSESGATRFKKWISDRKNNGKSLSATTIYHHLRHLKNFFTWLSGQTGFKSRIRLDSVSYLTMDKKKAREALSPKSVKAPTLEYVKQLTDSIEIKTEIDRRDQALISFLLLSGMRDKAIATLPLGCFDWKTFEIRQDPKAGVDTKFGKTIISTLIQFDKGLIKYVVEWAEYLEKDKLFGLANPLFPRSKVEQIKGGLTFISKEVEPVFWKGTGSIREILKKRSTQAGLDYYYPHSFRHAAVAIAFKHCQNGEQLKAISQNLGHSNLGTTVMSYGNLDDFRVREVVSGLDFSPHEKPQISREEIDKAIRFLSEVKEKT